MNGLHEDLALARKHKFAANVVCWCIVLGTVLVIVYAVMSLATVLCQYFCSTSS